MAGSVKRVTFAKNGAGIAWVDVNTKRWAIIGSCPNGSRLVNRACRLADRGMKLEYRTGEGYTLINATIEKMGQGYELWNSVNRNYFH